MKAGMGDGGACHPRDNIALRYLAENLDLGYDLFDAIMKAREIQALNLAKKAIEYGKNICIVGKAYKPGVPYTNGSYSLLIGHYLQTLGANVYYLDKNTKDLPTLFDIEVAIIGYWEEWVEVILKEKYFSNNCVVIDPWRKITENHHTGPFVHYGDTRFKKKVTEIGTTEQV